MNFFKRDIVILLLVSVLLGTLVARTVSYGANLYFQETLVSLVGDYGEYDLIVQVREENSEDGKAQLERILKDSFNGATYKQGPSIIGKANFFVALPEESKNQTVYENLDRVFSGIPGGSGVTILTEPRLNIRGIPMGTAEMLETEIKAIPGVHFVYRNGGSMGIVLEGIDRIGAVTQAVEAALTRNKIIEITFPPGVEPDNPVMIAESIASEIYRQLQPQVVQYVSVDTGNDDRAHLISTMQEMRRFLLTYATAVKFSPAGKNLLQPGDELVFQGSEPGAPKTGKEIKRGNLVVLLIESNPDGSFGGIITQGDATAMEDKKGYAVKEQIVGAYAGTASYQNPRTELTKALRQAATLVEQIPILAKESNAVSKLALDTLSGYSENSGVIRGTLDHMDLAVRVMEGAAERMERANVEGLKQQLNQSSKSMSGLIQTLRLVNLLTPDVSTTIQTLQNTQDKIVGLSELLESMHMITRETVQAKNMLMNLHDEGQSAVDALQKFEGSKAKENIAEANRKLNELVKMDFQSFGRELRYLADNAPKLVDEEIYRSARLMDKVIEGQVIPGKRLQIMVDRNLWLDAVKPIVYAGIGHQNVGVYEADLGVIEPNVYLQVYQVLGEVQAVLAGLTALVVTTLLLALDHTAVMSVLERRRLRQAVRRPHVRLSEQLKEGIMRFAYWESLYGMAMGIVLLSAIFFLAGGGIPYVPWYAVPFVGALLGFAMSYITEKITPVSVDEMLAGQSLGMSFDEIMREIVIPAGRPGLMQRLNRRRLKFK